MGVGLGLSVVHLVEQLDGRRLRWQRLLAVSSSAEHAWDRVQLVALAVTLFFHRLFSPAPAVAPKTNARARARARAYPPERASARPRSLLPSRARRSAAPPRPRRRRSSRAKSRRARRP